MGKVDCVCNESIYVHIFESQSILCPSETLLAASLLNISAYGTVWFGLSRSAADGLGNFPPMSI